MMLQHTKQKHHILVCKAKRSDKNAFVRDENFVLPETERCFQLLWLKEFPWLCYFPIEDALYCFSCDLFGYNFQEKQQKLKIFTVNPLHTGQQHFLYLNYVSGKKNEI